MRRDDSSLALSLDLPLARATSSRVCRLRLHGLIVASRRRVELLRRGPAHKRCQTSSFGPRLCGPLVGVFRPNMQTAGAERRKNVLRTESEKFGRRSERKPCPWNRQQVSPPRTLESLPGAASASQLPRAPARRGARSSPFHDSQLRFDQIAKKNSNQGHRKTYNSLTRCLECQRPTAEATHVDPPPRDEYKARLAAAWAC